MKLLSVAIPSYNSQDYLDRAVDSLLIAGEEIEIIIVNDGSTDATANIAEEYKRKHPKIVRVVHKENGGHGDAVMAGLEQAKGLYFKVVDSDDWVNPDALFKILDALREFSISDNKADLVVSNYIYDKVGVKNKKVIGFSNALLQGRMFTWNETRRFKLGQYILMHAVIYRTNVLKESGLKLPKHTFYVDSLYVYSPLPYVKNIYYLDVDFYHYFIGREDQSVQEQVMIRRIDQQIKVNQLMSEAVDLSKINNRPLRNYMRNYLEIITVVTTVLGVVSKSSEVREKTRASWEYIKRETPSNYRIIRYRPINLATRLPGRLGRAIVTIGYRISRQLYGFN